MRAHSAEALCRPHHRLPDPHIGSPPFFTRRARHHHHFFLHPLRGKACRRRSCLRPRQSRKPCCVHRIAPALLRHILHTERGGRTPLLQERGHKPQHLGCAGPCYFSAL